MATPVFCCGFECGVGAGAGAHYINFGAAFSRNTSTFRSGLASGRTNPAAATTGFVATTALNTTVGVARQYINIASAPITNEVILGFLVGGSQCGLAYDTVSHQWYPAEDNGTVTTIGSAGAAISSGWHLIDLKVNVVANPWTIDIQVDGVSLTQLTRALAASTVTNYVCGNDVNHVATFDIYHDDVLLSATSADYPLGPGYTLSYIPNADGTHNVAGANDFKRTLTGTDITNATTTAYQLVDDRPMETAAGDFINGIAPPNSTDYVEVAYEDSVEPSAPRSVEAIVGFHDAGGAGTNNWTVTLRDNNGGTSANIVTGTHNVGSTLSWVRAHFTTIPGGGAWTLTAFNALRSRFLVSDASPDPYIDGLMLEAEYAPALPQGLFGGRPAGQSGQSQFQQLLAT